MADDLLPELGDKSLGELEGLSDLFGRNANQRSSAAKAKGGVGANRLDDSARKSSQKKIAVDDEIFGRLTDIHESRSEYAQKQDESRKARKADSPQQWANDPNSYDWPGIDMP